MTKFYSTKKNQTNRIALRPLASWLLGIFIVGTAALCFVYLKNQQHMIGEQTRKTEEELSKVQAALEVDDATISRLTSRSELQRRIAEGFIKLIPVEDTRIARLTPPVVEPSRRDGDTRTAANERRLQ